jgi:amidase
MTVSIGAGAPVWQVEAGQPFLRTVDLGDAVEVATLDCRGGAIRTMEDAWQVDDAGRINPVTGPIGINGVRAGETVAVWVEAVDLRADHGLMLSRPNTTLFDFVDRGVLTFAEVTGEDNLRLAGTELPARPMVGWVGLQPAAGVLPTSKAGPTGGNMDTPLVRPGARVLLPAAVEGAGLYVGDVHASQGDGEIFLTGVEIAASVTLRIDGLSGSTLDAPVVETPDVVAILGPDTTLEASATAVSVRAAGVLAALNSISLEDAAFLLSAACDLRISRFLPHYGSICRMEIPKTVLAGDVLDADGWLRGGLGHLG